MLIIALIAILFPNTAFRLTWFYVIRNTTSIESSPRRWIYHRKTIHSDTMRGATLGHHPEVERATTIGIWYQVNIHLSFRYRECLVSSIGIIADIWIFEFAWERATITSTSCTAFSVRKSPNPSVWCANFSMNIQRNSWFSTVNISTILQTAIMDDWSALYSIF